MPLASNEPLASRRLGDFEIVREVGRGGMGVVYEARQVSLNRKVALKVLAAGLGLTSKAVARFQREAEAAARLHHTNIVPVYATGEQDGTHFYAMELIDGPSLDHVLKQTKQASAGGQPPQAITSSPPELVETAPYVPGSLATRPSSELSSATLSSGSGYFDAVARMVAEVADALEYAHQNGVIPRDVKPSNLLLSSAGRLSINDFGLARMLEQPGMTMTGEFVGTPAYMSPEQITAGRTPLDHRTDIYSLGATLYEVLTLQPPFIGVRREQLLAQILHKEPRPPRRVNRMVPLDLETICLKAMEKDPNRRYQTAGQMAGDLRRFVNRFAITARRAGPTVRLKKWIKRNPGLSAAVASALLATGAAVIVAYRGHVVEQQRLAEQQRLQRQLQRQRRQAAVDKAVLEAMNGNAPEALQAVAEAERNGVEPGKLNMVRGMVALHSGRLEEALVYLKQADEQLPSSAAVKALLTGAYWSDGDWERAAEMQCKLEELEPRTPEDYLLLAITCYGVDPVRALKTLDDAPALYRKSSQARNTRAIAQTSRAAISGRKEDAEHALDELNAVRAEWTDEPALLTHSVHTYLVAAHSYAPEDSRRLVALKQAADCAEQLAKYPENSNAVWWRCCYFLVRGDDDAALREIVQAQKKRPGNSYATDIEFTVLYGRKRYNEALGASRAAGNGSFRLIAEGLALVAMPGRKAEAEEAFVAGIRACKGGTGLASVAACLQLLGREYSEKSRRAALEIRQQRSHLIPTARDRWYHDLLAYHAGFLGSEDLLSRAQESRYNQCEAYFYVGLGKLADGKRAEAKACFARAFESQVLLCGEWMLSRAFLKLVDDPDWLPWIPAKK
jgi:serine/threonine protein kinase